MPSATAPATAAASAWLAALSGGPGTLEPQLLVMMCGCRAAAALNAAVTLTSAPDAEAVFTGRRVAHAAAAMLFADSPVQFPLSSSSVHTLPVLCTLRSDLSQSGAVMMAATMSQRAHDTEAGCTCMRVAPEAAAKMFADSPVPCPLSSTSGSTVPGPSTVGSTR